MGKKIIITVIALMAAAGAGIAGFILTNKKLRTRRFLKRTGKNMYALGTMLRAISCQECAE